MNLPDTFQGLTVSSCDLSVVDVMVSAGAKRLLNKLEEYQSDHPRVKNAHPDLGRFLFMSELESAGDVVEAGTSNGYSTIWLTDAAARVNKKVVSFEKFEDRAEVARNNLKLAGLNNFRIETGVSQNVIDTVEGRFGLLFLDIHPLECKTTLKKVLPKLIPGAIIIADNFVSHRDTDGSRFPTDPSDIKEFIEFIKTSRFFDQKYLRIGDGVITAKLV